MTKELVNHPAHYNQHPSGVECIDVIENMCCNVAFATKHIWRLGKKDHPLVDTGKAIWYLKREIARRNSLNDRRQLYYRGEHDRIPLTPINIASGFPGHIDEAMLDLISSDDKRYGIKRLESAIKHIEDWVAANLTLLEPKGLPTNE